MSATSRCTCGNPAYCPEHRCDCNIWCGHQGKARKHIFAPGEWCGGNDVTWMERSPGGKCQVHREHAKPGATP